MTDKLKQIIKDELAKLPKENREAIDAFDWVKVTEEICKKYLFESELTDFQVETFLVLIGLEDPEIYAFNIEDNVGTSREQANRIADEVTEKIFAPISDIIAENIKKSDKVRNANVEQNLDFVLSGGDYSAFVEPISPSPSQGEGLGVRSEENYPPRPDGHRVTPQEGNKPHMDDIKDRFTI
jgi:hypothetical protein